MATQRKWTRDEMLVAFNAYCRVPFQRASNNHPVIVELAPLIGRTPAALKMKIGNLGSFDSKLAEQGIVGLKHGAKIDAETWDEFNANPEEFVYESEKLIAKLKNQPLESRGINLGLGSLPKGYTKEQITRVRVNQSFFRAAVLNSYQNRCCISGVTRSEMVEACHILDWATHEEHRTNPTNGLTLNPFFHKAFDNNLFGINPDYEITISQHLIDAVENESFRKYLISLCNQRIIEPTNFLPNPEFLDERYQIYLKAQ